jgi:hypothetical protein
MNEQGSSFRLRGVTIIVSSFLLAAGIYAGGSLSAKEYRTGTAAAELLPERAFGTRSAGQRRGLGPRDKNVPAPPERFRAEQSVLLRTAKAGLIKPALASASTLLVNGVHLSGGCQPNYVYNQLNEIKPAMIQEATKNARIAAEQFSRDSQTSLGKLRSASQGWFQVEDRDAATPERKLAHVVVDVDYELN